MLYYILFKKLEKNSFIDSIVYDYKLEFKLPRRGWMDTEDEEYICFIFDVSNTSIVNHLLNEAMEFWFLCFHDHLRDRKLMDVQTLYQNILDWCHRILEKDNKTSTHASFLCHHFGLVLTVFFHLESLLTLNTKLVEHKLGSKLYYNQPLKQNLNLNPALKFQRTPPHSPVKKPKGKFDQEDQYKNHQTKRTNSILVNVFQSILHPWIGDSYVVVTCGTDMNTNMNETRNQDELLYLLLYYMKATHIRPYHINFETKSTNRTHETKVRIRGVY